MINAGTWPGFMPTHVYHRKAYDFLSQVHEPNRESFGYIEMGEIMAPTVPVGRIFLEMPALLIFPRKVVIESVC